MNSAAPSTIVLAGLDGSHPLAFLAVLGIFRAACIHRPASRLSWDRNSMRPILHGWVDTQADRKELIGAMLATITDATLRLDPKAYPSDVASISTDKYRQFAKSAVEREDGLASDLAACLAVEGVSEWWEPDEKQVKKGAVAGLRARPTLLSHAEGASGKVLVGMFRKFVSLRATPILSVDAAPIDAPATPKNRKLSRPPALTLEDFLNRLLAQWTYHCPNQYKPEVIFPAFRWDPAECRSGAFEADTPVGGNLPSVPGANAMAVLGLTLFPSVPSRGQVKTLCMVEGESGHHFTWPLWEPPLCLNVMRSTLSHDWSRATGAEREAIGITALFASARYTADKGSTFFRSAIAV